MRRNIIDNEGMLLGWFETDKAREFDEDTYFDGHNHCGCVGRSQWSRESLFRTAGGCWARYVSGGSQSQRVRDCEVMTIKEVADWLIANGGEVPEWADPEVDALVAGREV
jgi:hypothetical protein